MVYSKSRNKNSVIFATIIVVLMLIVSVLLLFDSDSIHIDDLKISLTVPKNMKLYTYPVYNTDLPQSSTYFSMIDLNAYMKDNNITFVILDNDDPSYYISGSKENIESSLMSHGNIHFWDDIKDEEIIRTMQDALSIYCVGEIESIGKIYAHPTGMTVFKHRQTKMLRYTCIPGRPEEKVIYKAMHEGHWINVKLSTNMDSLPAVVETKFQEVIEGIKFIEY